MDNKEYNVGTIVVMKKAHPCGINEWEVVRVGADIKIRCTGMVNAFSVTLLVRKR